MNDFFRRQRILRAAAAVQGEFFMHFTSSGGDLHARGMAERRAHFFNLGIHVSADARDEVEYLRIGETRFTELFGEGGAVECND